MMARIRTIKPEFCTSEQIAELSTNARLLFVLMWMFCDDGGNHPASLVRLKMECFPGDDLATSAIGEWIDEMTTQKLIVEYEAEGEQYWHVTGWKRHQRIDRPTYRHPQFDDTSTTPRRAIDEPSPPEGNGREGSRMEGKGVESKGKEVNTPKPPKGGLCFKCIIR